MTIELGLLALGGITLLAWVGLGIDGALGQRWVLFLRRCSAPAGEARARLPPLSVVFGARNEAEGVEPAVRSMLALDYPDFEVVAVNDRSDDATGDILARLAAADDRLRVVDVTELPSGWLGKNHALWTGAHAATGDLILFTDADVIFEPSVAARAVAAIVERDIDHVAGATDVTAHGFGLQLFIATFALFFNGYFRPWRAGDPRSDAYVGFGGFNLVRRTAYERAGTHAALAMDPLDDVNLGKALKKSGAHQVCAVPGPMARVEWYPTLTAAIRGLEKNTMAGVNWSFGLLFGGMAAQILFTAWPFLAILMLEGPARWLNVAVVIVVVTVHGAMLSETSLPTWLPLFLPIGVLLVAWTYMRAAALTYWRGGIEWRGTFYSLAELRRGELPPA
ncbi:MAG: glycosyltransferase [Acidobacteria bacterium]|nr:glycosyltransferase [Acidobacteriota bacterium]